MIPTFTTVQLSSDSLPEESDADNVNSTADSFVIFSTVTRNESSNSSSIEDRDLPVASTPQFDSTPDRYVELRRVHVKVRTSPLAVSNFFVRASTIIAVLVWEVLPNRTGGYAIRDFTAEMRKLRMTEEDPEERWETIDPRHISPNAVRVCDWGATKLRKTKI